MKFSECLKNARKKEGLTQSALAKKSGLAIGTIQQYELDKRSPRPYALSKIANALNMGCSYDKNGEPYFYDFKDNARTLREGEISEGNTSFSTPKIYDLIKTYLNANTSTLVSVLSSLTELYNEQQKKVQELDLQFNNLNEKIFELSSKRAIIDQQKYELLENMEYIKTELAIIRAMINQDFKNDNILQEYNPDTEE